jgi:hypothetical protein
MPPKRKRATTKASDDRHIVDVVGMSTSQPSDDAMLDEEEGEIIVSRAFHVWKKGMNDEWDFAVKDKKMN